MELSGQDKDTGIPEGCATPRTNQGPSSKLFAPTATPTREIRNESDHHHHQQQLDSHYHIPGRECLKTQQPNTKIGHAPDLKTQQPPHPQLLASSINSTAQIRYRECLKNHAAGMGGHIVDGCREFMPGGEEGSPQELKCGACNCHRNFHRKEVQGEPQSGINSYYPYNHHGGRRTLAHLPQVLGSLPLLCQQQHRYGLSTSIPTGPVPPMIMTFGFSGGSRAPAESSSEDLNMLYSNSGTQPMAQVPFSVSKKRYRTKFTQEQKDRMQEFAEKLGWKIQRQDEQEVHRFCAKVGVKRQAFKVWMHNSKQAVKRKQV